MQMAGRGAAGEAGAFGRCDDRLGVLVGGREPFSPTPRLDGLLTMTSRAEEGPLGHAASISPTTNKGDLAADLLQTAFSLAIDAILDCSSLRRPRAERISPHTSPGRGPRAGGRVLITRDSGRPLDADDRT